MLKKDLLFAALISFVMHILFFIVGPKSISESSAIKKVKAIEITLVKTSRPESLLKKSIKKQKSVIKKIKVSPKKVSKNKHIKDKKLKAELEIKEDRKFHIRENEIKTKKISEVYKQKTEGKSENNIVNLKETVTLAVPNYNENPKPNYSIVARRRGYEGIVILKVKVLEDGKVGEVKLLKSSGYSSLDNSAIKTVKKWQFIPGEKGNTPIAMWVNVPIRFELEDKG
jgi:protein TonB